MAHEQSGNGRPFENDLLTHRIIGAAIEVHRILGPGLLESTYEDCLCFELGLLGIRFEHQVALPLVYKSLRVERAYKPDLLIENSVVVELKTVEKIVPVHEAQMLTYLKLSGFEKALLFNFNSVPLKAGIRRFDRPHPLTVSPSPQAIPPAR